MKKKLILLAVVLSAFAAGYGVVADAYPWPWPYNRNAWRGYWEDRFDSDGRFVIGVGASCTGAYNYWNGQDSCNAIPSWVDTAGEFTSFVIDKYNNGNATDRVGAAFIILTMIGENRTWPVTGGEQAEFINRVNAAAPYTLWNYSGYQYNLNSYNQRGNDGVGPNDIALYDDNQVGHRAIVFRNSSLAVKYVIKTRCANPVGFNTMPPLDQALNFNVTGDSDVSNPSPSPGSTITFFHYLENDGPTGTAPTTIWWVAERMEPLPVVNAAGPAPWGTLAAGERREVNRHDVIIPPNALPGDRFCERVGWDPVNSSGGTNGRGAQVCATVPLAYTLTPTVNPVITSGGVPILGNVAEAGDTISFRYNVQSVGTVSQVVTCTYRQATYPGNNQTPPTTIFTPAGSNCPPPRTFPGDSSTDTATEVVPAAAANTTICRSMTITPSNQSGGTGFDQKCVFVAAKPYTRVWGGDISAGNGLADASGVCTTTTNNNGSIVGWNKRAAGSSAGAGVQFAAFALARITDYATALYDPGGAPSPNGLSFANTSGNAANGDYGGSFGSAPCIPDYYATRPAAPLAIPATVAAMNTGVYGNSGTSNVSLGGGGIVNPNNRISVYVNGNVYITGNITYSGSWDVGSMPLFELIVSGNIYIDNDVTQLDGVYVAQASAVPNSGQIITCATGFSELAVNSLYANCNRKLTVNGLFTANRIQLLRTIGTLSQSNTSEASTVPHIAEVFNYGPSLWIKQPVRQSETPTPDYDAIISLPPIL